MFNLTNFTDGGDSGNLGKTWKVKDKRNLRGSSKEVIVRSLSDNKKSYFSSIKECSLFLGIKNDTILKYYIDNKIIYKNNIIYLKHSKVNVKNFRKNNLNREILEIDDDGNIINDYLNSKIASEKLNICYSGITMVLSGKLKKIKNHKLVYKDDKLSK